jgi:DNA-binding response OmpR family regulator
MPKPSSFEELLARVKGRIRPPNEAQAVLTLVYGEATLDLLTRRVTAAGIEHGFTVRESTTFEFFTLHPGQVISREQLLSRALGLRP